MNDTNSFAGPSKRGRGGDAAAARRGLRAGTDPRHRESCTGGMLATLLTDVQGVAHAFDRGFVTYSEEAKTGTARRRCRTDRRQGRGLEARCAGDGRRLAGPLAGRYRARRDRFRRRRRRARAWSISPARGAAMSPRTGRSEFGAIGRGGVRVKALTVTIEMMSAMLHAAPDRMLRAFALPSASRHARNDPSGAGACLKALIISFHKWTPRVRSVNRSRSPVPITGSSRLPSNRGGKPWAAKARCRRSNFLARKVMACGTRGAPRPRGPTLR